jgi:hypothetical protein
MAVLKLGWDSAADVERECVSLCTPDKAFLLPAAAATTVTLAFALFMLLILSETNSRIVHSVVRNELVVLAININI